MRFFHMDSLSFAFNAIAPTFTIVLVGILMRKMGYLNEEFIKKGNKLCFSFFLPALVFFNIYEAGSVEKDYIRVIIYTVILTFLLIGLFLFLVPKFVKDKRKISVMIQSMYRGNFMLYGIGFSQALGGDTCVAYATSMMAVTLPILNVVGIFVYAYFSDTKEKPDMKKAALDAIKMPILWGIILGLVFHEVSIQIPDFLYTAGKDISKIATPLSFLFLGGQFQFSSSKKHAKFIAVATLAKLILVPLPFLWFGISVLHITGIQLIPLLIYLAAPSAITNYQLAAQFDADAELAGELLVCTMAFSALSMFLLVGGLHAMSFI